MPDTIWNLHRRRLGPGNGPGEAMSCRAKTLSHDVMTSIQVEDEHRALNKLEENVAAVERLAGHRLERLAHKLVEAEA